jgi:hypothetical protein
MRFEISVANLKLLVPQEAYTGTYERAVATDAGDRSITAEDTFQSVFDVTPALIQIVFE